MSNARLLSILVASVAWGYLYNVLLPDEVVARPIDRKLTRCMVYLPDMSEGRFKRWCLKQSERMP
jgi:hypothetical protein